MYGNNPLRGPLWRQKNTIKIDVSELERENSLELGVYPYEGFDPRSVGNMWICIMHMPLVVTTDESAAPNGLVARVSGR